MRVISSPSISTTGFLTLIFAMVRLSAFMISIFAITVFKRVFYTLFSGARPRTGLPRVHYYARGHRIKSIAAPRFIHKRAIVPPDGGAGG
ncbi:hypothetical protein [Komagataeibacter sp. FNDCF1]|uniref:hypothetical protein n=1 Tax=Komagataeibacter sp. FNDCF1 TaxID=2878681 RepID=UPI001E350EC8|nr:hypothetical protein [Komagataeibacter sp. FNDCF1]MCE2565099.1 hypothetical protein [Komagataeibacter sp. FNDCF1]